MTLVALVYVLLRSILPAGSTCAGRSSRSVLCRAKIVGDDYSNGCIKNIPQVLEMSNLFLAHWVNFAPIKTTRGPPLTSFCKRKSNAAAKDSHQDKSWLKQGFQEEKAYEATSFMRGNVWPVQA